MQNTPNVPHLSKKPVGSVKLSAARFVPQESDPRKAVHRPTNPMKWGMPSGIRQAS